MGDFNVNAARIDPYKNFKFRVIVDGVAVAGISKVSPLRRSTEVVEHRSGGDASTSHKAPGRTEYDAITLEKGVTHDTTFENWANSVSKHWGQPEIDLGGFRKDITIQFMNEAGDVALAYNVYRCWVSEYQALPELDANGARVAIELLRLENEGWERDTSVPEPAN
jgi:phage tail-like protein